jgi:allophanate hydrolase subunit 2
VFEITAGTFRARPTAAMTLAAAGPGVDLRLDGRAVAVGAAHHVESGVTVEVRVRPPGLRAYLAAGGGIDVPLVQGSRSTDTLAWFGGFAGRALAPGDRVPVAATAPSSVSVPPPPVTEVTRGETRVLDAIAGPQTGSLTRAGIRALASEFTVTPQADRTGVRLSGPPVPMRAAQMVSEPLAVGAVQVTPAGELVVLLANHQTHGGYPKPLVVLRPETVAQLRPGTRVRFRILD